jgi:hypothetical protein
MAKKKKAKGFANVRKPKDYVDGKNGGGDDGYKQTTKFGGK